MSWSTRRAEKKERRRKENELRTDADRQIDAYENAIRLIDSPGKWSPEKTEELVAIVQPVASSFTEEKVKEWTGAVVLQSVGKGADPDAEVKLLLRQQIGSGLEEFKRLRTELK